ncbi:hypothetical protein [Dictyobacter arantiisoli]|uniref:Uncharacterized protein n=1 Tax=Dictyobacter arantiisoli TaxID=2014874 RepID=A0A5A5TJB8_9CHLR|nr:hypothetical protein [Dictyobacter arantiisoli]GCF11109.1 hypothetical protein KDI_46730 [Dictyobacter arantiisoli]
MNLFGFWKRQSAGAPVEVIQAACDFYGIAPERVPAVKAEKLKALSDNIWVVKLNDSASAVVAYSPDEKEHTLTARWFGE